MLIAADKASLDRKLEWLFSSNEQVTRTDVVASLANAVEVQALGQALPLERKPGIHPALQLTDLLPGGIVQDQFKCIVLSRIGHQNRG